MYELLTRRSLLKYGVATLLAAGLRPNPTASALSPSPAPFTLGIASGDPTSNSVVLWTRLAFDPFAPDGGMAPTAIPVSWEVATDPLMSQVVRRGVAMAMPDRAHAVHVRVIALAPDRWYWYRFRVGGAESPVGRTRTFPAPGEKTERLRMAFVSCQHFEHGLFTAYEHLAAEELDVVLHLGDYIYEGGASAGGVRSHLGGEAMTLDDYRMRHALYRTDPALQAAHAQFPFIVTWDDHEVENNYARAISEDNDTPGATPVSRADFLARRANAYRAYFEHMPLAPAAAPIGSSLPLYRQFSFGQLADFFVLDTRQYRSNQPCGGRFDTLPPRGDDFAFACGQEQNAAATMMGSRQEQWLSDGLASSSARWKTIAQQVMMTRLDFAPTAATPVYNMDAWDGYVAARNRLLGLVHDQAIRNVVVLTGDIHASFVADLQRDFDQPGSPVVATELVGTSISSEFPPIFIAAVQAALTHPPNAHVKFFDGLYRGYVRCDIDEERWRADFRAVATVLTPGAPVTTLASFEVRDGNPGAVPVS